MKNNNNRDLSLAMTVRFSNADYLRIVAEAERSNSSKPEVVRQAVQESQARRELNDFLIAMEKRMLKRVFEMLCSVADLKDDERLKALRDFKRSIKRGANS